MSWLEAWELDRFASCGKDVKVSRQAIIFGVNNIHIGDNTRIDTGCIIAAENGSMLIGNHVHLAPGSIFQCGGGIILGDHCQVAAGCKFVSASDDLGGEYMVGPCAPIEARKVYKGRIMLERFAIVGVGSIVLPLVTILEGAVVGAGSLVKAHATLFEWSVYYGQPATLRKRRYRDKILAMAKEFEIAYENSKV